MKPWIRIERIPGMLASAYIKATRMVIDSYYRPVAEEIAATMNRGLVLDLGTGPGHLPVEIARLAPEIRIIGVDLSRKMVSAARVNAAEAGVGHQVTFEVGNSARLRFEDACFDMVISTGMLHSLKDPVGVFREIYRVLKKGGRAWVYDPANLGPPRIRRQWMATLGRHEKFCLWLFTALRIHRPARPLSRQKVQSIINATDFREYEIHERKNEIRIKMKK
jgi:ubiquinone/menaquinone biosynthesis C-methylase UbiE